MKNALIIILFALSISASATTYYIDPAGNNSNDGSAAHPWLTLAFACGHVTISGSIIHVNAGTYIETSQIALTIGVSIEGVGNTSIIKTATAFEPLIIVNSSTEGTNGNQSISYIKLDGSMICKVGVFVKARSNVSIHHCWFVDFTDTAVTFNGLGGGYTNNPPSVYSTGNKFYNNIINNCSKYQGGGFGALQIGGQDGMLIYDNIMTQTERSPGCNGWLIKYYGGNNKGLKIYKNTLTKAIDGEAWPIVIELWLNWGGVEIYDNVISGEIDLCMNYNSGGYPYSVSVHDNIIGPSTMHNVLTFGVDIESGSSGLLIYNNYIRNVCYGVAVSVRAAGSTMENINIYNNIIDGIGLSGNNSGDGISWDTNQSTTKVNNINIWNNVINKGSVGHGYNGIVMPTGGTVTNISVRNNIITGFERYPIVTNSQVALSMDVVSVENNIMYDNDGSNDPYFGFTPSHLTNQNNLKSDPIFITANDFHLKTGSPGIGKGLKISCSTTDYDGNTFKDPPCIGAFEYDSTPTSPAIPAFQSSVIENATPAVIEMTYNMNLSDMVPPGSAFTVLVNSVARTIYSISVPGTKVTLTLASAIVYGDVVTVAYTKPSANPLQTTSGGQAESISAQTVTNKVTPLNPVYISSAIEYANPNIIEMTYNMNLADIVPPGSAFTVLVNSVARTIFSISVPGTKVTLTLASAIVYGDVVTVAYTKPSVKPLQTTSGGQAASISAQTVTNKVTPLNPVYVSSAIAYATPDVIEMTYNMNLADIVPPGSAFTVLVNSVARTIFSISVPGTKVTLTLASTIVYGDVVTVAYTKPSANPLQTTSGGQAESIIAQTVTNKVLPTIPVIVSLTIENATPAALEMTYNRNLANIVPSASAFSVRVNSAARNVNSVVISGTKVILTLASAAVYGDVITVAYNKPSANPLQTPFGGQPVSISAQTVTNKVSCVNPIYVSSAIENITPSLLEMTYNLSLASIIPASTAFIVQVNGVNRNIISVAITANKVRLTLANAVVFGEKVTISYSKPGSNWVQTTSGGVAANITSQSVTNNCSEITKQNDPPILVIKNETSSYSGFVGEIDASGSYDLNNDILIYEWIIPNNVSVSSTSSSKIQFLSPVVNTAQNFIFQLKVNDGKVIVSRNITINIMPYKPDLTVAKITNIQASLYNTPDYPNNIADGNMATKWSVNGDNQWLVIKLVEPFEISHIEIAFLPGQKYESYFDIFASKDNLTWESILNKTASCNFSGDIQVFDFPAAKSSTEYSYIKLVGHGNSLNTLNSFSEFKTFGILGQTASLDDTKARKINIYPNPAHDFVNISIEDPTLAPQIIKIIDLSGKIVYTDPIEQGIKNVQIPDSLKTGIYIVTLESSNLVLYAQKLIISNQ